VKSRLCRVKVITRLLVLVLALLALVPLTSAQATAFTYEFPVQGCSYTYARSHHDYPATDILTKIGCRFVAPISGTIDEVNRVDRFTWKTDLGADRGGLSVSLIGDDGVRYYGSHLSFIPSTIVPGLHVAMGDVIGKTGDSGDAKGLAPHLHFGISWPTPPNIWWVRRGELYPWRFLDAWRKGINLSPVAGVKTLEKKFGTVPPVPKK
jgi:peptidoglycan LD-endopeptidase LytH